MKRAPLVGLGTVAGIAGVLLLNPSGGSGLASAPATTNPATTGTTTATNTSTSSGSATGDSVFVRYGNVQVKVTAQNGKITDIQALELPNGDGRSQLISQQVESMLRDQALQAQSAKINGVSGATFTSYGYATSLQSALDKLGI
ncbi:MAG: FMN-binding protein [Actinomycetes bacterium]